ncbi:hypothetical protein ABEB36_014354 [Hypothenemus hampei]|uniref:C2H2-type domain-containing protein n=1 Tax=Hypothenemus hampei TaxID=57062 RepID=A0ABD1E4D8_HYPHA
MEYFIPKSTNENYLENMEILENGNIQDIRDTNGIDIDDSSDYNFIDILLGDGTKATIVNGTLVTVNGQTFILQDGTDLSHYSLDDNTDEIVISKDNEEELLQCMTLPSDQIVQYVQEQSNDNTNSFNLNEQVLYIQDNEVSLPIHEQYQIASIDTQSWNEDLPTTIKLCDDQILGEIDGIIDLEEFLNDQQEPSQANNSNNFSHQYAVLKEGKFYLQSSETPISLLNNETFSSENENVILDNSQCTETAVNNEWPEIKGRNLQTGQIITLDKPLGRTSHLFNDFRTLSVKTKPESLIRAPPEYNNLRSQLINKKIPIGQTSEGKRLIGRIVNVLKTTDVKQKNVRPVTQKVKRPIAQKGIKMCNQEEIFVVKKLTSEHNTYENVKRRIVMPKNGETHTQKSEELLDKVKEIEKYLDKNAKITENNSKVIVQQKVVTKDCFDTISRTVTGLMNMESVAKKLNNKTIIIKIIQKTFERTRNSYSYHISYCSGYMVREMSLDSEESFCESWKFIVDTNSRETILGEENKETRQKEEDSPKKFAHLTIQVTVNQNGNKNTKVIVNPPALFQCKSCLKSFRTSALLKIHALACGTHNSSESKIDLAESNEKDIFECRECDEIFQSLQELNKHMEGHYYNINQYINIYNKDSLVIKKSKQGKKFSCNICSRQFSRHSNLQRHKEIHKGEGAMYQCAICSCSYQFTSSLTRHVVSCHMNKDKLLEQNQNVPENNESVQIRDDNKTIPTENIYKEGIKDYIIQKNLYLIGKHSEQNAHSTETFDKVVVETNR